jgi:hypothetical protein
MTIVNIGFAIDCVNDLLYIDNVSMQMTSNALAGNIKTVIYSTTKSGMIVYNDRPPIPETFVDPSPYQVYIEDWMTLAAAASPPLTLAQAQAIKNGLIDGIWIARSQAPVSVVTSLGTYSFSLTPGDPICVLNDSALPAISGVVAQFGAINTAIENMLATINAAIDTANTDLSGLASGANAGLASIVTQINTADGETVLTDPPTITVTGLTDGSYAAPAALGSLSAPVKMMPIGSTSYPAFTVADLFAVLSAAQTQIANETAVRATKQAAVNALSTVTSVISYDATAGW